MRPILHPQLINEPFGDPGVYLEFLFDKRALLFDLGDLRALSPRKLLRVSDAFVSHTHMDHFAGFDDLVRISLGRDTRLRVFGPAGFIDQIHHKLAAYTWNLVHKYRGDFAVEVGEVRPDWTLARALFRCRNAFRREELAAARLCDRVLLDEPGLRVRVARLDHGIPCLAFSVEEKQHVNVWKTRLEEMGLEVGPWLRELKQAVWEGRPDDTEFRVWWRENGTLREFHLPLGKLKAEIIRIVPGQKVSYVTDAAYNEMNAARIVALAQGSDILFIEAPFLHEDAAIAAEKRHLTAYQAGRLGRRAKVRKMVPFHFSPRYAGEEERLRQEAREAFYG